MRVKYGATRVVFRRNDNGMLVESESYNGLGEFTIDDINEAQDNGEIEVISIKY